MGLTTADLLQGEVCYRLTLRQWSIANLCRNSFDLINNFHVFIEICFQVFKII